MIDGKLISVEPCFTDFGQRITSTSDNACEWIFTTKPKAIQGIIFEVEAPPKGEIGIEVDHRTYKFTLEDLLRRGRVIALKEEAMSMIWRQFKLRPEDIENPDVYWHHAWKIKLHRAIPQEAYHVRIRFKDNRLREGRNYYYLRITQVNGQMAWSSPIWIDK